MMFKWLWKLSNNAYEVFHPKNPYIELYKTMYLEPLGKEIDEYLKKTKTN